ncbi:hypothetical protein CHARACLAT_025132 [Characodon lateralis]|uniref:Uncharacterized protein n=1 Tax=Characodon lateralis TaxID=208331 RepID=A0ABU7EXR8_9TELE|nr:hypothetical protein [Characodon lateralis]
MVTHSLLINTEGVYIPCMGVPDIKLQVTFFRGCFVTLITETIQDGGLSTDLCNHSSALFRIKVLKVYFRLRVIPKRESVVDSGVASGDKEPDELLSKPSTCMFVPIPTKLFKVPVTRSSHKCRN